MPGTIQLSISFSASNTLISPIILNELIYASKTHFRFSGNVLSLKYFPRFAYATHNFDISEQSFAKHV